MSRADKQKIEQLETRIKAMKEKASQVGVTFTFSTSSLAPGKETVIVDYHARDNIWDETIEERQRSAEVAQRTDDILDTILDGLKLRGQYEELAEDGEDTGLYTDRRYSVRAKARALLVRDLRAAAEVTKAQEAAQVGIDARRRLGIK